ncbi:ArsR/SmtB family transcription factor [Glutamicibacter sp.]|uniref:ArsR/SmtB family transcription factor n=1 Tax=Glutamicibacter sp. TaxID=1931995 RepID=UPI002B4A0926|nr:metalloregulator ArsR/SmtB family transcription factor [Glutamicibacter sp.]HJX76926.1 metalloregulator ArsR/SmtB family transcription factor [Glutamicibacter sp.]
MAMIMSVDDAVDQVTQLKKMAALFHALADPTRLLILEHLLTGEHKVKELTEHLGLAQSTVSAHLACLRESDLVSVRAQGRASLYSRTESTQLSLILTQAAELASVCGSEHHWHEEHPNQPEEV